VCTSAQRTRLMSRALDENEMLYTVLLGRFMAPSQITFYCEVLSTRAAERPETEEAVGRLQRREHRLDSRSLPRSVCWKRRAACVHYEELGAFIASGARSFRGQKRHRGKRIGCGTRIFLSAVRQHRGVLYADRDNGIADNHGGRCGGFSFPSPFYPSTTSEDVVGEKE
jgi:hypothetical protein